jgi:hypothetical protein
MTSILRLLCACAPPPLRKRGLRTLFRVTASAFDAGIPAIDGDSFDESLAEYARFTREEALKLSAPGGRSERVREELFRGGRELGERIRRMCMIRADTEAVSAMEILYGAIGITADSRQGPPITVRSCYFSGAYSPEVCAVMSALDAGIFAGLSRGGKLSFRGRITDGSACCTGDIAAAGDRR